MKLNETIKTVLTFTPRPGESIRHRLVELADNDSHMIKPNEYGNINIPDSGYIKNVVVNGKRLTARQFAFNPKTSRLIIYGIDFSKQ